MHVDNVMNRHWQVIVTDNEVVIDPPEAVNAKYDDLRLKVTGNMLEEDKIEVATKIVSVLNAHLYR